jgi:hypothetical protein
MTLTSAPSEGGSRLRWWARTAQTAAVAGGITVLTTLAIETCGGAIGAALGSCPHVIVVATARFYATYGDSEGFAVAVSALPVGILAGTATQGVLWTLLPARLPAALSAAQRLLAMLVAAAALWLGTAAAAIAAIDALRVVPALRGAGLQVSPGR